MNNKIIYWITVIASILYIIIGNWFFTKDINFFEPQEYDAKFVQAKVIEIIDGGITDEGYEDIVFNAKLLDKEYEGNVVTANQIFDQ